MAKFEIRPEQFQVSGVFDYKKIQNLMNYCTSVRFLKSNFTGSTSIANIPQLCETLVFQSRQPI